jgi:HD-GYP domain-containing protein (c-di-GMP phosphodiesterase class II)
MALLDQPFPPREAGDLTDLTSSVRLHGILSPLLLRQSGNHLQIVCGYRRYLAARSAGISQVPALIAPLRDAEAIRSYLSEDVIRRPLTPQGQDDTLQMLKELRDGMTEGLKGDRISPMAIARPEAGIEFPVRQVSRAPGVSRLDTPVRDSGTGRVPPPRAAGRGVGEHEVTQSQKDHDALKILERMRNFLDVIRASKTISVPEAETLLDDVLNVVETYDPHDLSRLSAHEDGHFLASHSILVTALCARAGKYVGWTKAPYRSFLLGGLLHDVGMVLVRQAELHSPQSLPQKERTVIASHTRIGCALISATRAWDNDVAHAARDHHERWNGSGYPEGKKGTGVAFSARLIGFLDTYASLIIPRPHRDALTPAAARLRLGKALELGLFDLSLYTILQEVLSSLPWAATFPKATGAPTQGSGKGIELKGELVTMLSKECI